MGDGKKIVKFELIDHGADHASYFGGCGVSFTEFHSVYTGCGSTPAEAFNDACDQLASDGSFDFETIKDAEDKDGETFAVYQDRAKNDPKVQESKIPLVEPGDGTEEAPEGSPHPEWYHYVSIRVK